MTFKKRLTAGLTRSLTYCQAHSAIHLLTPPMPTHPPGSLGPVQFGHVTIDQHSAIHLKILETKGEKSIPFRYYSEIVQWPSAYLFDCTAISPLFCSIRIVGNKYFVRLMAGRNLVSIWQQLIKIDTFNSNSSRRKESTDQLVLEYILSSRVFSNMFQVGIQYTPNENGSILDCIYDSSLSQPSE